MSFRLMALFGRGSATPLSDALRALLAEEELHGARVANRFRYVVFSLLLVFSLSLSTATYSPLVNYSALALYLIVTVTHSLILRKPKLAQLNRLYSFLSIIVDYVLIYGVLMFYTINTAPDNFGFAVKNPILLFGLFPLLSTALQFRFKLMLMALTIQVGFTLFLAAWTLHQDVPRTGEWLPYVLGPAVIPADLLLSRPLVFLAAGVLLAYTIARALQMAARIGQAELQRQNLARYFSPQVVSELTANTDILSVGGRRRVTILFSDIRNFTAMSEGMSPDELAAFLGEFRERMADAIFAQGGTLDKFVGDAIMAIFGAPQSRPEPGGDARAAIAAARGMLVALEAFNADRRQRHQDPIRIGIGLHSGDVFAGNVGQGSRLEYTVIGDAVNTASRIESLCKKMQAALLVSEETRQEAGLEEGERMPRVMVKGKATPLQVYRLAGDPAAGAQSSSSTTVSSP